MKKILLSSIIMLGVCGAVNAQTSSKTKKNDVNSTSASAAAPTPQKAAVLQSDGDAAVVAPVVTAADKQAVQVAAPVNKTTQVKQAQAPATATVKAAVVTVPSDEEKIKADKAEKAKAAGENEKKNQQ